MRRVFGESAEEVAERDMRGDVEEETVRSPARKTGAVSSEKELDERNSDHALFSHGLSEVGYLMCSRY